MKIRLIIEKDPETGRYSSVFAELPGCASAGDTEEEAIADAREALELWFEPNETTVPETARLVEVTTYSPPLRVAASLFPFPFPLFLVSPLTPPNFT